LALIADNIIVFLFRVFVRAVLRAESRSWNKIEATIDVSFAPDHDMYPYAEICYIYMANGEEHYGRYKRGFWYDDSAKNFARQFVPSEHLTIRVCPEHPEKSYVFEEDQSWW
jgi:hypothetical protein